MRQTLRVERLEAREVPAGLDVTAIGSGPNSTPRARLIDAGGNTIADFRPFEGSFTGGVTVATGDVTNDTVADLIVGAGVGGGPRVRVFDGAALRSGPGRANPEAAVVADFFAFEQSQRGGTFVASGSFAGQVFDEVVVGAGPGGGPRVRVLDGQRISEQRRNYTSETPRDTVANFFAFESTFRNGVTVAASPTRPLTFSNLAVAPGLGGGPRVRVLSGIRINSAQLAYTSLAAGDALADFTVGDASRRAGLYVSYGDYNGDGAADVAVGTGPGVVNPPVTVFSGAAINSQGIRFTGAGPGDAIERFALAPVANYANGVTVGTVARNNGPALLMIGTGSPSPRDPGRATAFVYGGVGTASRTQVFSVVFDTAYADRVNVGV